MITRYPQFFVTSEVFYLLLMIIQLHMNMLADQYNQATVHLAQYFQITDDDFEFDRRDAKNSRTAHEPTQHKLNSQNTRTSRRIFTGIKHRFEFMNGSVVNHYEQRVLCWTGEPNQYSGNQKFFYLEPSQTSPSGVDVDHVQDPSGQWWKVGWSTTLVGSSGLITDAACKTPGHNKPCTR